MNIHLREFREASGQSQREFAKTIGKSFRTIQMWECGDSYPNAEMIWRMCEYFGTDPNTFMAQNSRDSDNDLPAFSSFSAF